MGNDSDSGAGNALRPPRRPSNDAPFSAWRDWAWHLGMFAASDRKAHPNGCETYIRMAAKVAGFSEQVTASLLESERTAFQRCRKPVNAPEIVAECIKWYESRWGTVRTTERLGRSPAYPKLLLFAYCLGRDGKPFTFAENRMANASGEFHNTVRQFLKVMIQRGEIILVREGVKGVDGSPAWYRLTSPERVFRLLALDRESPYSSDCGMTFEKYLFQKMPSLFSENG